MRCPYIHIQYPNILFAASWFCKCHTIQGIKFIFPTMNYVYQGVGNQTQPPAAHVVPKSPTFPADSIAFAWEVRNFHLANPQHFRHSCRADPWDTSWLVGEHLLYFCADDAVVLWRERPEQHQYQRPRLQHLCRPWRPHSSQENC